MYLLTFIVLVISLLGLFAQLFLLQTADIFSKQKGVAETMIVWHNAAVAVARDKVAVDAYTTVKNCDPAWTSNCSCTLSGSAVCNGNLLANTVQTPASPRSTLPKGYNYNDYRWRSYVYTIATTTAAGTVEKQRYVATFVMPTDVDASTKLISSTTPGLMRAVGITMEELYMQLKKTRLPSYTYGKVTLLPGQNEPKCAITAQATGVGGLTSISLPVFCTDADIPVGSLAIVTGL